MHDCLAAPTEASRPIHLVDAAGWAACAEGLPPVARAFAEAQAFSGKAGSHCLLPEAGGRLFGVVFGLAGTEARHRDPFLPGKLATLLPDGVYRFETPPAEPALAALAWCLGSYAFTRYRKRSGGMPRLVVPAGVDGEAVSRIAAAVARGRDLVNTPANDLGPQEIEAAVRLVAAEHGAVCTSIVGDALLAARLPMIHAVGRASSRAPRLIDLVWGDPDAPKVTLVGKGVAFDSGGLDIKPSAGMLLMKKDMGGAAAALAAAEMAMGAKLPIRLRLLIPAVENAISGSAFRPGDILDSRKGLTVEIGNTDAEGRLILGDALALADEDSPDLVFDFATLTGAARTALGPDLPPFYTEDDGLAADLARLGIEVNDPVWRMPLWPPYASLLESKIADTNHVAGPMAGSVTAALFLRKFATEAKAHVHFDIYAWNPSTKPGRPEGGEVQAARLVFALLSERYGS